MEITEVRIKLMEDPGERLQAFCSITFDHCFVVRDLKIIGGANGSFVAMPSRRLTSHCPQCGCKNHLKAGYCNQCGLRLKHDAGQREDDGRVKLYADIAHPINQTCRDLIQQKVIEAFLLEQERAKLPGYVSSYDDFDDDQSPAPRRGGSTRRDDPHRPQRRPEEPRRAEEGRRPDDTRREPLREAVIRKVPPTAPTAPAVEPPPSPPAETTKVEPAAAEPRPPHVATAPHSAPAPTSTASEPKKTSFGEGIL